MNGCGDKFDAGSHICKLVTVIACSIFTGELLIMLLLAGLEIDSKWVAALLDSSMLVIFVSPAIYIFIFKPIMAVVEERRKAEQEMKEQKEKAEQATMVRDKFVSLVSHDLRGPLNNIQGFIQVVVSDSNSGLDKKQRTILSLAHDSCHNMSRLIEELLSISRLKTGTMTAEPLFGDCHMFAMKAEVNHQLDAERKGVKIINNIPEGTRVFVDPLLFGEVLDNLLSNAIKFSSRGNRVVLAIEGALDGTVVSVKDEGIGISKEMADKLFFYDEKTSTIGTDGEMGTGLGLPLCKDLMEAHGGEIWVESDKGNGTTFYLRTPDVKPVLLLVDDESFARTMLRAMLGSLDVEIVEASSGVDALAIIRQRDVHLVISDVSMPNMDGFALLREIRKGQKTAKLPVLMLTADTELHTREKAFRLGANDFADKAGKSVDIVSRIQRFIP